VSDRRRAPLPADPAPPSGLRQIFESDLGAKAADATATRYRRRVLAPLLASPPAIVVDLGCGRGVSTLALTDGLITGPVIGVDWGHGRLVEAARAGMSPVRGTLDPAALPFRDSSCDLVLLTEVIEHLVETDLVLDEIHRILRPDGLVLLTTPNLASWFNRVLLVAGRQPVFSEVSTSKVYGRPGTQVVGHLRLFTLRALVPFLHDRGFVIEAVGAAPYHDTPRGARWLDRLLVRVPGLAADLVVVARRAP